MLIEISKRKLESYKRAEAVAQEARLQLSEHGGIADNQRLLQLVLHWMKKTGNIQYQEPKFPKTI